MASGSAWTQDAINAQIFGAEFTANDIVAGSAAFASTTATTDVITHGLTGTPDFVIAHINEAGSAPLTWTANSTSVTFTRAATTAAKGYSYIIGVLA